MEIDIPSAIKAVPPSNELYKNHLVKWSKICYICRKRQNGKLG